MHVRHFRSNTDKHQLLSTENTDPLMAASINHWCNLWQTVCSSLNTLQSAGSAHGRHWSPLTGRINSLNSSVRWAKHCKHIQLFFKSSSVCLIAGIRSPEMSDQWAAEKERKCEMHTENRTVHVSRGQALNMTVELCSSLSLFPQRCPFMPGRGWPHHNPIPHKPLGCHTHILHTWLRVTLSWTASGMWPGQLGTLRVLYVFGG